MTQYPTASRWACTKCSYCYDTTYGDPESGIAPGTPFSALPSSWRCPGCGATKDQFYPED